MIGNNVMKSILIFLIIGLLSMVILVLCGCRLVDGDDKVIEKRWTEIFNVDKGRLRDTGRNSYFILEPGYHLVLEGREEDNDIRLVIKVLDETEVVDGVTTRVVEERETKNGEIIEVSRNFYAIDETNNSVLYFGEDVDIYENGEIVSHEGAWRSGKNGARFGLMMPGIILLGSRYYQEIAEGVAMDRAEIVSDSETIEVQAGKFSNCIKIEETTPLEPTAKGYKYYAFGIGLVKDGNLELIEYGFRNQ